MSGKREKRRRAEEARRVKLRKRRRLIAISLSLLIVALLSVAVPMILSRRARMARVNVLIPEGEPYDLLAEALRSLEEEAEQEVDGSVALYRSPGELPRGDRDVRVAPAAYGTRREQLVAVDPYILTLDRRAGESPLTEAGSGLPELTRWLGSLDSDRWTPFVVGGDREDDFAALLLYLAGELLEEEAWETVTDELRSASLAARGERSPTEAMAGEVEAMDALVEHFSPVVEFLEEWKERGVLVFNWTNYDRIAVEQTIREGRAAVVFQRRSELEYLVWEEAFHLRMRLPPVGPARRIYSMVGYGISGVPGDGVRSDAAPAVIAVLRSPGLQERIENESSWSPVVQEGTPINREHRDIVRWVAGAQEYLVLEGALVDHPIFRRLHQLLR